MQQQQQQEQEQEASSCLLQLLSMTQDKMLNTQGGGAKTG